MRVVGPTGCAGSSAVSFIAMAAWTLIPIKIDDEELTRAKNGWGVFGTTLVPSSSPRWATRRSSRRSRWPPGTAAPVEVVLGTTLGMMIANVPAVFLGDTPAGPRADAAGPHRGGRCCSRCWA
jgi:hypothetical protein